MTEEKKMTEAQLEEVAGGIQNLAIGGNVGALVDNSVNNSGNTTTVTQVDVSQHISDSFNSSASYSSTGYYWPW